MVMVVLTYTEQLARKLDLDDPAQGDVREIRAAAERAAGLTRELLTFARRHANAPVLVNLHEVFASLEGLIGRIAGDTVSVEMSLCATLASVFAERADLEQALINLALNARDAMPSGGVLTIATSDAAAGMASRPQVEVLVRDTGVGMDDARKTESSSRFSPRKPAVRDWARVTHRGRCGGDHGRLDRRGERGRQGDDLPDLVARRALALRGESACLLRRWHPSRTSCSSRSTSG